MGIDIVVARYMENPAWVKKIPDKYTVWLYNKNPRLIDPDIKDLGSHVLIEGLAMTSPGHEAHTYLYHILTMYPYFADTTYFVQGNPFDHTPDLLDNIKHVRDFDWLVDNWITCDYNGCPHHCNLPIGRVYEGIFNEPFPAEGLPFVPGAQFAVSKKQITAQPLEYYEHIAYKFENEYKEWWHWSCERLWKKIFTGDHRR